MQTLAERIHVPVSRVEEDVHRRVHVVLAQRRFGGGEPEVRDPAPHEPLGMRSLQCEPGDRVGPPREDDPRRLCFLRQAAKDGVDEPGGTLRAGAHDLDRLAHGGVRRDPIEEENLCGSCAQGRAHVRVEPVDRAREAPGEDVVEERAVPEHRPDDGPEERPVARRQAHLACGKERRGEGTVPLDPHEDLDGERSQGGHAQLSPGTTRSPRENAPASRGFLPSA